MDEFAAIDFPSYEAQRSFERTLTEILWSLPDPPPDGGGCTCVQVGPVVTVAPDCQLHGFAFEGFVLVGVELPVSWPRVSEDNNQ